MPQVLADGFVIYSDKEVKEQKDKRKTLLKKKKNTNSFTYREDVKRTRRYYVHDNGGRPFMVEFNNKSVKIFKRSSQTDYKCSPKNYTELVYEIKKFIGVWRGYDSSWHSRDHPQHGNSILVKISKNEYVFIGSEVYKFVTDDEIIDYISVMGNNDVPYPIAYSKDKVYFMIENSWMLKSDLKTPSTIEGAEDIMSEYYDIQRKEKSKRVKSYHKIEVEMIHERL